MRKQFVDTIESLLAQDERLVLLLGDIGVFGFRRAFEKYPERVYNVGICESAMIGMAAGLAKEGFIPVVHSIAPFIVERCFEQLKDDLCYQQLPAKIVSVGASYDYAGLGCTHHCPGDVAILRALPGMEIVVPGTPKEFDQLFRAAYNNRHPTYFRLSDRCHHHSGNVQFGQATLVQQGRLATIVAVGPTLSIVLEAAQDLDVTILYYSTIVPFDGEALQRYCGQGKIVLVEPYHAGVLTTDIHQAVGRLSVSIEAIGVPHRFLREYGRAEQHDEAIGLTPEKIRARVKELGL